MNNVYENEMRFAPFLKFIDKYKNLLILLKKILANTSSRMMSYIIFPYQILSFGDL